MSKLIFIWNIDHNKKVKIKEIREYNIVRESGDEKYEYCVDVLDFFMVPSGYSKEARWIALTS